MPWETGLIQGGCREADRVWGTLKPPGWGMNAEGVGRRCREPRWTGERGWGDSRYGGARRVTSPLRG